jgi:transposase-like protein
MKRKNFTKEFKAKVALEAIKGERTMNEIASEFGVHATQVNQWKKQLLEGAGDLFDRNKGKSDKTIEKERDHLYQKVGQLQVELDWLKKKTGHLD